MQVVFLSVSRPFEKLKAIVHTAHNHFLNHTHLLIRCKNDAITSFLDEQLWLVPKNSFLPHIVCNDATKELIALTTSQENINQAHSIFNLTKRPLETLDSYITKIYEFDESSSNEEVEHTKQLYEHYKQQGYRIQSRVP